MRRAPVLAAVVLCGVVVAGAGIRGQQPPSADAPIGTIRKVRNNLYVIPGQGGNTVVFVTRTGVVLVDTKLPGNGEAILDQVRAVSDEPVSMIINTHVHPDHTGSNDEFSASVQVVMQVNAGRRMTRQPARTFTDRMTLGAGNDRIELYYFGAGHTNGDAFVVFPAVRAMAAGDMFASPTAPSIDAAEGGSLTALADSLEKAATAITSVDTVIEGHGGVNTWAGFVEYTRFVRRLAAAAPQ